MKFMMMLKIQLLTLVLTSCANLAVDCDNYFESVHPSCGGWNEVEVPDYEQIGEVYCITEDVLLDTDVRRRYLLSEQYDDHFLFNSFNSKPNLESYWEGTLYALSGTSFKILRRFDNVPWGSWENSPFMRLIEVQIGEYKGIIEPGLLNGMVKEKCDMNDGEFKPFVLEEFIQKIKDKKE